jgi:hypothetical protein
VIVFAVAMGYMEAIIVVYLRHLSGLAPAPGPEVDYRKFLAYLPHWALTLEQAREVCTIVMLATLALAVGRSGRERLCVFFLAFGVWDLLYYVGLKLLLDWPPALTTTDILFLIPKPWFAPVWLPVAISAGFVTLALVLYPRPKRRRRRESQT